MFGVVRLIILGLLIGFAIKLYRKFQQSRLNAPKKDSEKKNSTPETKKMTPCDQCGVYIPNDELIREGEHVFCCPEHLQDFKK